MAEQFSTISDASGRTAMSSGAHSDFNEQARKEVWKPKPIPELPARYEPTQKSFAGRDVVGVSPEFLKNQQVDSTHGYNYGAREPYPDIWHDAEMQSYLQAQNNMTLDKVGKGALAREVNEERIAASYELPDAWKNAASVTNAIDAREANLNAEIELDSGTYKLTEDGAPNRKLAVALFSGGTGKTLIEEPKDFVIEQVIPVTANDKDKFAVVGARDGASVLYMYDEAGKQEKQIPLPGYGLIEDVRQGNSDSQLQFLFDSTISAPRVITVALATGESQISPSQKTAINSDDYVTEKLMVSYSDIEGRSQNAPVYVSHRKDIRLDGETPALTQVYGGNNIAPKWLGYYPSSAAWLRRGGIVIDPVLPGDGGRGTKNYQAGNGAGIENTERALEAALKKVQDMHLTSAAKTGIYGRSNGGMVVNTLLNRNPRLVGAAVSESGVDSLIDNTTINVGTGKYWKETYGDPQNPSQGAWMTKLDVLSNLSKAKHYPPTLIEVGAMDGVVNAGNGISVAAIRQRMNNGETLLYTRANEGHDPSSLDLQTAFLWSHLGLKR